MVTECFTILDLMALTDPQQKLAAFEPTQALTRQSADLGALGLYNAMQVPATPQGRYKQLVTFSNEPAF